MAGIRTNRYTGSDSGASGLRMLELDGTPDVQPVTTIYVSIGTTQVPDESMMSENVPSQDIPSYVGEYSDTNPVEVEGNDPQPVIIHEPVFSDNSRADHTG